MPGHVHYIIFVCVWLLVSIALCGLAVTVQYTTRLNNVFSKCQNIASVSEVDVNGLFCYFCEKLLVFPQCYSKEKTFEKKKKEHKFSS